MKTVTKNCYDAEMYEIISISRLLRDYDEASRLAYIETARALNEEKIGNKPEEIIEYYFMKVQQMEELL